MRLFISILFFVLTTNCFGQKIHRGQLISAISNRPIANAHIENEHGQFIGESDSLGFFSINPDSNKNIVLIVYFPSNGYYDTALSIWDDEFLILRVNNSLCKFNKAIAEKDIRDKHLKLICVLGFTGKPISKKEMSLAKKYQLTYEVFGCTGITMECFEQYNRTIANYLDKKYGIKWRLKVRKDICGIND